MGDLRDEAVGGAEAAEVVVVEWLPAWGPRVILEAQGIGIRLGEVVRLF